MCIKTSKCQTISPFFLVKIKQHLLLKFILPVIDGYGVIMPIQPMNQCLKRAIKARSEDERTMQKNIFKRDLDKKAWRNTHLNGWFIQMAQIGCCLPWFLTKHHGLWIDQTKGIDNHLPFDALYRINNHSHSSLIQSLKTLHEIIYIRKYPMLISSAIPIRS